MSWLKKILKLLKPKKKPRPDPVPAPPLPVPPANDLVDAINVQRAAHSLPPLRADARLMRAAEEWAEAMAANQVLDHGNFAGRMVDVVPGARGKAENIAFPSPDDPQSQPVYGMGYKTVPDVVRGWMNSAGHRRNILGAFNAVGVGRAVARNGAVYWVADMASL
jgi:uncharacterized protein YkwD